MANGFSTEVTVKRRASDGWYVYTCSELPGLFVASEDDKVAYNDVPESIRALIKLDYGVKCSVSLKLGYGEFQEQMKLADQAVEAVDSRTQDLMESVPTFFHYTLHSANDMAGAH